MTTSPAQAPGTGGDAASIARWLEQEHAAGRSFESFAARAGIDSTARAYDVQREYVALRQAATRSPPAGYKIGLTSASMQAMCGIDTPVAGVILQQGVHQSGVELSRADFGRLGIEFEIAVRLGRDLAPAGRAVELADLRDAVEAVAAAIEVIDDRHCDYKSGSLDVLSLIADNAWNAGIVLGPFVSRWPDLASVRGRLLGRNQEVLDTGTGASVMGNPLQPVVWLANHLRARGLGLQRGDIVMTGSMMTTKFPTESGAFVFEASELGSVEVRVRE